MEARPDRATGPTLSAGRATLNAGRVTRARRGDDFIIGRWRGPGNRDGLVSLLRARTGTGPAAGCARGS